MMGRGMHGMGGGMRPSPTMMRERMTELAKQFKEKGAISSETAMTPEELELPPMFEMMMTMPTPLSQSGAIIEHKGKYYLEETRINM